MAFFLYSVCLVICSNGKSAKGVLFWIMTVFSMPFLCLTFCLTWSAVSSLKRHCFKKINSLCLLHGVDQKATWDVSETHCSTPSGTTSIDLIDCKHQARMHQLKPTVICRLLGGNIASYPPVLGADNQQAALSEGTKGNSLTALTVDGFGLFFKHRIQVLNTDTHKLEESQHTYQYLKLYLFNDVWILLENEFEVYLSFIITVFSHYTAILY